MLNLSFRMELLSVFLDQNVSSSHSFCLLVLVAVNNGHTAEVWGHVKWEKEFVKQRVFDAFKVMTSINFCKTKEKKTKPDEVTHMAANSA